MPILDSSPGTRVLRSQLYNITQNRGLTTHAESIEALRNELPHSIQIVAETRPPSEYNCVMHALSLSKDDFQVPALAASQSKPCFIDFLIGCGHLLSKPHAIAGTLIVYSLNGVTQHIGRIIADSRVESKWGAGHLYQHAIPEVPCNYGDEIAFFPRLDRSTVIDCFYDWQKYKRTRKRP